MNEHNGNQETIQTYEGAVEKYIDRTGQRIKGETQAWMDKVLNELPSSATVLELGSASGRDADYIESKGFKIQRTDAVKAFVDHINESSKDARVLNALTDDFGGPWNMVFANAVFLHFTKEEFRQVLGKAKGALLPGGLLALSVKPGEGTEWESDKLDAPRFFQYWNETELQKELSDAGFDNIVIENINVVRKLTGKVQSWIMATAHRPRQTK